MKQLKINITGKHKSNLLSALDKIKRKIQRGYFAGFSGNSAGGHKFEITEVKK